MAEILTACNSFIKGFCQVGGTIIQGLQTAAAFNYKLVSAIFQSVHDSCIAAVTITSGLGSALLQILYYIGDFVVDVLQVVLGVFQLIGKFVVLVYHICSVSFAGIAQVLLWIAEGCVEVIKVVAQVGVWIGAYLFTAWEYVRRHLEIVGEEIAKYAGAVGEQSLTLATEAAQVTSSYSSDLAENVKDGVSISYTILVEHIAHCLGVVTDSITRSVRYTCMRLYETIPTEVYLYVILATSVILLLRILLEYMHRKGMTFPLLRLRGDSVQLPLDYIDYVDLTSGSEEEEDSSESEEEGEEEDQQIPHGMTVLEETDEEDEIEEYEVASDSEEEEEEESSEEEEVNVQLPQPGGRYNLRVRHTPSPPSKRSPGELEKVLENERDRRMCVVCQDQFKNVLVLPCKHMCLCIDCAHQIARARNHARRVCPLCRSRIITVMDVYV